MRVAGHILDHEGSVWDYMAQSYVAGWGRALCSCGTQSEPLPTTAARQRWHRGHKEKVAGEMEKTGRESR